MEELATAPLRFGLSEKIIDSLCSVFERFPAIEHVLIYGSRSAGNYGSHSDIDLAVRAPGLSEQEFSRLWTALDDLPIVFKLDVLWLEQLTNPALKRNILDGGQQLYPPATQPSLSR